MSYLAHRCTQCGHPDMWRLAQANRSRGAATRCPKRSCGCRCTPNPAPEVLPTYGLNSKPVERIVRPGDSISPGMPTCGCEACQAMYADLTGGVA